MKYKSNMQYSSVSYIQLINEWIITPNVINYATLCCEFLLRQPAGSGCKIYCLHFLKNNSYSKRRYITSCLASTTHGHPLSPTRKCSMGCGWHHGSVQFITVYIILNDSICYSKWTKFFIIIPASFNYMKIIQMV